jgi:opacity protein-like surface antigen
VGLRKLVLLAIVFMVMVASAHASDVVKWQKWNTFGGLVWYHHYNAVMVYLPIIKIDGNPVEVEVKGLGTMVGRWNSTLHYYFAWLSYDQWLKFKKKTNKVYWNVRIRSYTTGLRYKGKLIRWVRN